MKWNYLTVSADIPTVFDANGKRGFDAQMMNNMLAKCGAEEWELVNILEIITNGSMVQANFIFKKPATNTSQSEYRKIGFDLDGDGEAG